MTHAFFARQKRIVLLKLKEKKIGVWTSDAREKRKAAITGRRARNKKKKKGDEKEIARRRGEEESLCQGRDGVELIRECVAGEKKMTDRVERGNKC